MKLHLAAFWCLPYHPVYSIKFGHRLVCPCPKKQTKAISFPYIRAVQLQTKGQARRSLPPDMPANLFSSGGGANAAFAKALGKARYIPPPFSRSSMDEAVRPQSPNPAGPCMGCAAVCVQAKALPHIKTVIQNSNSKKRRLYCGLPGSYRHNYFLQIPAALLLLYTKRPYQTCPLHCRHGLSLFSLFNKPIRIPPSAASRLQSKMTWLQAALHLTAAAAVVQ